MCVCMREREREGEGGRERENQNTDIWSVKFLFNYREDVEKEQENKKINV